MLTFRARTHFSRWALTDPSFAPQADTSLFIPDFGYGQMYITSLLTPDFDFRPSSNICVVEENSRIILVNDNRELYELDLKSMNFNEGTFSPSRSEKSSHDPYCHVNYHFSSDGYRLVVSYITCPQKFGFSNARLGDEQSESPNSIKTGVELRFVELSGTAEQIQKVELEYLEPKLPKLHGHDIDFSPDLSMVRAGRQIFDLQAPDYPLMSVPNSLFNQSEDGRHSDFSFSPCNNYLIDYNIGEKNGNFGLFRICRTTRTIEKLAINGVADLVGCINQAEFHPILPLLLLTSSVCRESEWRNDLTALKVVQIDLREPKPVPIVLFEQ